MKERPILFSGPMVRALLEGRKTQTRRLVKPHPSWSCAPLEFTNAPGCWAPNEAEDCRRCPFGVPGDRLWVKERVRVSWKPGVEFEYFASASPEDQESLKFRSSIHMPRRAARIILEITGVRVERVLDITEADAIAEGFEAVRSTEPGWDGKTDAAIVMTAADSFLRTFYDLNKRAPRDQNPWVWVVEFKRVEAKP